MSDFLNCPTPVFPGQTAQGDNGGAVDFNALNCDGSTRVETSTGVVIQGVTQPIPVCTQGGEPIELGGFETLYDGIPAHIEIIRDETTGAIDRYVAHYKDGSGTVVDPADPTLFSTLTPDPEIDGVISNWQPICVDGIQHYVADRFTIDNTDGSLTFVEKIYKQGAAGTIVNTAPVGTVVDGVCLVESADLVECVVGSANLVTEALDVNLGAIKEVVSPGSTLTTFHTLLGNNLDIQGDGLTNLMGAGINANISGSTYIGAQFTYTFNLIGEDDPGDPADFGITVWDNVAGTSVTATSITSTATYAGDAQGSGLNVPFYAWGAPGTYTIVWTGDLPVGDYTIGYMNQNFSPADHVELQVTHNLVDSMTTSKAQLVALDQCTINALNPVVADLVECEVLSGGGVVTEGLDANLNAISTLLGIPTPDNRHILLGNTLSISSTGSSNVMAAGLNVAATGLITGAQFTFNIDLIADSDPGDPADFGVVVWDNVAGTSVLATSITAPFPMSYDPQGSGLNFPLYANPVAPQSFQVVWTGDLPAGDYTVGFILQDQNAGIGADSVNLSVTHNITAGNTTTTKAQLVALDQCTINALTPEPVVAPIEVPNGRIIINPASMSVIVGSSLVRSFSVKGLDNAKYNISFDNSATWLTDIDGGDSWGEGNEDNLNISQVVIQPTVSGDRVFIHWETI